jgi:mannan endo-1,4-beta-mannosidase
MHRFVSALLALLAFTSPLVARAAAEGFHVRGTQLLDASGTPFVMRGVNVPHAWFRDLPRDLLEDVAGTGANAVRIVLATGDRWPKVPAQELARLLDRCAELGMVAVVEVHDCTGYGDLEEAAPLSRAVDYWREMQPVLRGREATVIVNIANEPFGNNVPPEAWFEGHVAAIARLRAAGFTHTLMVDAAHWGQDWQEVTLDRAPELFAADPLRNLVFSVHMYEIYEQESRVRAYLEGFHEHGLPLVIGEFAADHGPGKPVAAEAIMRWAEHYGFGYLGWSWSGNSGDLDSLDVVEDFDPARLTPWGRLLIEGPHGIRATARKATGLNVQRGGDEPALNSAPPVP